MGVGKLCRPPPLFHSLELVRLTAVFCLLFSGWIFSRSCSGRLSVTDLQSSRASPGEAHSSSTFPPLAFANRIIRCATAILFSGSLRSHGSRFCKSCPDRVLRTPDKIGRRRTSSRLLSDLVAKKFCFAASIFFRAQKNTACVSVLLVFFFSQQNFFSPLV